jgi:hypothetical protein
MFYTALFLAYARAGYTNQTAMDFARLFVKDASPTFREELRAHVAQGGTLRVNYNTWRMEAA